MNTPGDSTDVAGQSEGSGGRPSDPGKDDFDLLQDLVRDTEEPLLEPGMKLGADRRFTLLSKLGEGGSSWVWLAKDEFQEREVALKIFKQHVLLAAGGPKRLLREIKAVQSLDHDHIVKILEVRENEPLPFFAMEWINGVSLRQLIDQRAFYNPGDRGPQARERQRRAAELLERVASALHHTHQRGIIHRDVKPGNILVETSQEGIGKPYLTDFGLSKHVGPQATVLTRTGYHPGTIGYYAPERILKQNDITTSWDVWSLGVVLYELLTGRLPFQAASDFGVHDATLRGDLISPGKLNPHADPDLVAICLKCLRRNPDKRYQSPRELGDDLAGWLEGKPISVRAQSVWERTWEWITRNPMAAALAASIILGPTTTAFSYVLILPYMTNTHAVRRFENGVLELEILAQKNERCSFNIRKDPLRANRGQWAVLSLQGNTNGLRLPLSFCLMADQGGLPDPIRSGPIIPGHPFKVRPGILLGDYLDRYYYLGGLNFDPVSTLAGHTNLRAMIVITNAPEVTRSSKLADVRKGR